MAGIPRERVAPAGVHRAEHVEALTRPPYETQYGPSKTALVLLALLVFALAIVALLVMVY